MPTQQADHKIGQLSIAFEMLSPCPQSVINFHLSDTAQNRLEDLIYNAKNNELTQEEKQELDAYLMLEHIMTLAKAKAHQYLNGAN